MSKRASWNVGNRGDREVARGLDRLVHHGVAAVGLQECGDRYRVLRNWTKFTGWEMWLGEKNAEGAPSTPIIWDPDALKALRTGTKQATPTTNTGRIGVGPSHVKAKVFNYVRFEVDGDEDELFLNSHGPASVWAPKRRRLAEDWIAAGADFVEHREDAIGEGRVYVVMVFDGNAKPSERLWKPLRKLGMTQRTKDATHGRRTIDLVWTLGVEGRVEVIGMPSDHRAAVLAVR